MDSFNLSLELGGRRRLSLSTTLLRFESKEKTDQCQLLTLFVPFRATPGEFHSCLVPPVSKLCHSSRERLKTQLEFQRWPNRFKSPIRLLPTSRP